MRRSADSKTKYSFFILYLAVILCSRRGYIADRQERSLLTWASAYVFDTTLQVDLVDLAPSGSFAHGAIPSSGNAAVEVKGQ